MPVARGVKIGVIGVVCAGMFGVAGYGAYNVYTGLDGSGGGHTASGSGGADAAPGPLTAKQVARTADAFLTAWAGGEIAKAAALTDSPQTATAALTNFRTQGHVTSLAITGIVPTPKGASTPATPATPSTTAATGTAPSAPTTPAGPGGADFTVTAHLSADGVTSTWTYASSLTVDHDSTGAAVVTWHPSVVNPALAEGDSVVTGTGADPETDVTDRNGKVLTGTRYPSLTRIIDDIRSRDGDKVKGGTPDVETYVQHGDGSPGKVLKVLRKGKARKLTTTLDAGVQAAAEKAVQGKNGAGVTALDIHDGTILAVANSDPSGTDIALQGADAPGSTMKIVTSAALIERGMGPGSPAPCNSTDNVQNGRIYHNDSPSLHNADADLLWDFANSCNTGFITQAPKLGASGLRDTAAQFGLTQPWNIGTATPDDQPGFPDGSGADELTSEMIGQGRVVANPLIMASVAATAATGSFHEPRIVAASMIDGRISAAGVGSRVSGDLRELMRGAITAGTATGVMSGFGADSGAKTGSAEVDGQAATNGWFTAFAGDVAVAAVVHDAGFGNTSAGPIVAQVLRAS
ncbi:putative penicillin-binding protein [Actinacidiphila reveromycinica]|uniref:Putative penicillin-binding protein n=1 Tax=Actinacidiphila reveromycinica TaxID=659352 RepID=A0A7U3VM84_9ACTN|nr:penicillin-binding transpeptidase domain-containing protein [Streptomyces sp. SN-593]BBA96297.1 putative penicillin-binding protein [Streptomyces sp. SN-593]